MLPHCIKKVPILAFNPRDYNEIFSLYNSCHGWKRNIRFQLTSVYFSGFTLSHIFFNVPIFRFREYSVANEALQVSHLVERNLCCFGRGLKCTTCFIN